MEDSPRSGAARGRSAPLPGLALSALIASVSALATGFGVLPRLARGDAPAVPAYSQLSEVAPGDIDSALATMDAPRDQLAQFRARAPCDHRLAWVTIAGAPGQPPGQIRLQSGTYFTAAFTLTPAPVRVAIPYPAAYATGHGTLSVVGSSVDAVVALDPAWHVRGQAGAAAREVTWTPVGCSASQR